METHFQNEPFKASLDADKEYWYCTCGQSSTFPFCDGNHEGTGKTPIKFNIPEADAVERLVDLIKEHNKWVEPESQEQ